MPVEDKFAAFAEEMKEAISSPDSREAMATKITKYISDSIDQSDLASLVLPKETLPIGTTAEYTLPGKLKAYWHEPGSYAPRTAMTQKVFTVPTWMISAHPEYEISQLESGRYGTAQDQVKAAKEAILGATNARIFNTLSGSIASTDNNYFTLSSKYITPKVLNHAINWVEDQFGGVEAIIGRRNILYPILDWGTTTDYSTFANTGIFSDSMKEQVFKTGKISAYRNIPLIGIPQWRDGFGRLTIPQNEILVVGKDVGKYVINQALASKEAIDVDNLVWHIHLYMRMGAAVFFPDRMAKISITYGGFTP